MCSRRNDGEFQENVAGGRKGKVYLVGAGPGDPDLLTMKAVQLLSFAGIVLHDALVSEEVLALVTPTARLMNVGKRCGKKSITQDEINSLMVDYAKRGSHVVRLKSGDPSLFGRCGEELNALREAGVDFEIVPGITSAVAAAAAAGISLTDRRCVDQVLLISAHQASDKSRPDWCRLISSKTTVVVYMPGAHAPVAKQLIEAGLSKSTPCIVISKIALPEELAYRTTLGALSSAPALPAPSLLIVGETAGVSSLPQFQSASSSITAFEMETAARLSATRT
jgi:uroporphyrin-III C-methyltransferase